MGDNTGIEWTDATWNPTVGCSLVSPGCTNCYAMKMAGRIEGMIESHKANQGGAPGPMAHYEGTTLVTKGGHVWTGKVALAPDHILHQPLKWKRPRRIFVNSMSDLFHESIPDAWIDRVFAIMALCPQHTFQVLTKRPVRMYRYLLSRNGMGNAAICKAINQIPAHLGNRRGALEMPLPNVWLGVSVENQAAADERIPLLLQTPAAKRFISAEPLLGPLSLRCIPWTSDRGFVDATTGETQHKETRARDPDRYPDTNALDWVIAGGESGPGARPTHPSWARTIRDQCATATVPFFFKQWGNYLHHDQLDASGRLCRNMWQGGGPDEEWGVHDWPDGTYSIRIGKKNAGALLDGVEHKAFPA